MILPNHLCPVRARTPRAELGLAGGLQFGLEGDSLAMVKLWGCSHKPMSIGQGPSYQVLEGTMGRILVDVPGIQSKALQCPVAPATLNPACLSVLIWKRTLGRLSAETGLTSDGALGEVGTHGFMSGHKFSVTW